MDMCELRQLDRPATQYGAVLDAFHVDLSRQLWQALELYLGVKYD